MHPVDLEVSLVGVDSGARQQQNRYYQSGPHGVPSRLVRPAPKVDPVNGPHNAVYTRVQGQVRPASGACRDEAPPVQQASGLGGGSRKPNASMNLQPGPNASQTPASASLK